MTEVIIDPVKESQSHWRIALRGHFLILCRKEKAAFETCNNSPQHSPHFHPSTPSHYSSRPVSVQESTSEPCIPGSWSREPPVSYSKEWEICCICWFDKRHQLKYTLEWERRSSKWASCTGCCLVNSKCFTMLPYSPIHTDIYTHINALVAAAAVQGANPLIRIQLQVQCLALGHDSAHRLEEPEPPDY